MAAPLAVAAWRKPAARCLWWYSAGGTCPARSGSPRARSRVHPRSGARPCCSMCSVACSALPRSPARCGDTSADVDTQSACEDGFRRGALLRGHHPGASVFNLSLSGGSGDLEGAGGGGNKNKKKGGPGGPPSLQTAPRRGPKGESWGILGTCLENLEES